MAGKTKILALSLGQTITTLMILITQIVLSRILTKNDLATYRQTFLAYEFVTPILTFGIPTSIYYFLSHVREKKIKIVLESIFILILSGGLFSIFLYFGGNNILAKRFDNKELVETLKWFTFYPMYSFPLLVLVPILIIIDKIKIATLYNVISNILLALVSLGACYITKSYKMPILIKILLPSLFFPILLYITIKELKEKIERPNLKSMISMIKFGIPLGISSTLAILSVQLDKIIVSSVATPEEFAVYSNGAIEIPLIGIITGSIASVIIVEMKKHCENNEKEKALLLFKTSAIKTSLLLFPIMVFLFLFAKEFMEILFSKKYIESYIPFRIYLLLIPIRIMNYGSILTILGKTKEILLRGLFDLGINFILSIILVKYIGYYGPAYATVLTIYLWHVPYNLFEISKGFNTKLKNIIFYKKILKNMIVSLISILLTSFIYLVKLTAIYRFLFGGLIFSIVYITLGYNLIEEINVSVKFFQNYILTKTKILSRNY